MMDSVVLTPLQPCHIAEMATLEAVCFSDPWSADSLRGELDNPLAWYCVAERDGRVVGYAGMHVILDEAHVMNIAVSPEARRQGVGRRLCGALLAEAVRRRLTMITLEVRSRNAAAIALYTDLGFAEVGRRRGYYHDPDDDALLMIREVQHEDFGL